MSTQKPKQRSSKKPLYRKVNTRTHGVRHGGGEYKWDRHNKKSKYAVAGHFGMGAKQNGLDYKPLFKFLLSKVGQDWAVVHSEAVSRLDIENPIFWMVSLNENDKRPFFVIHESAYFSGLYVDDENILCLVRPDLAVDDMEPSCSCCTHTLNGEVFTRKYDPTRHRAFIKSLGS